MPWKTDKGYRVLQQAEQMSCGLCCCAIVLRFFDSTYEKTEDSMKGESRRINPVGYTGATRDRVGATPTPFRAAGVATAESFGNGTYANHLSAILTSQSWDFTTTLGLDQNKSAMKTALRTASLTAPVIIRVGWGADGSGGGHWVVACGRSTKFGRASTYTILDPADGGAHENSGSTNYNGSGSGIFTGWWVKVTGRTKRGVAGVRVM
jgi:hypothetical protein